MKLLINGDTGEVLTESTDGRRWFTDLIDEVFDAESAMARSRNDAKQPRIQLAEKLARDLEPLIVDALSRASRLFDKPEPTRQAQRTSWRRAFLEELGKSLARRTRRLRNRSRRPKRDGLSERERAAVDAFESLLREAAAKGKKLTKKDAAKQVATKFADVLANNTRPEDRLRDLTERRTK